MIKKIIMTWAAPSLLALFASAVAMYFLLIPASKDNLIKTEYSELDAKTLEYFTAQAEEYAKDAAKGQQAQTPKKSD